MIPGRAMVVLGLFLARVDGSSHSVFQIAIPVPLFREGGYPHVSSLFGTPIYDVSVSQRLYYSNSTLCEVRRVFVPFVASGSLVFVRASRETRGSRP